VGPEFNPSTSTPKKLKVSVQIFIEKLFPREICKEEEKAGKKQEEVKQGCNL
jgi:hypothetical protein